MDCKNQNISYINEHICPEPSLKRSKAAENCKGRVKSFEDFDALSKQCLATLKEEYCKSFYTKFGSTEKNFLENRFTQVRFEYLKMVLNLSIVSVF